MELAAVLFDVDGALLDSAATHHRIWTAWAKLHRLDADEVWRRTFGRRPEDTVREVAPQLDPVAERHVLNELMRGEGDAFPAVEGAGDLLGALRPGSWAIVTSGSRRPVHQRFGRAGLPLPEVQVYGEDVQNAEPHPEPYLLAAARLGTEPARCVVVEDARPASRRARRRAARSSGSPRHTGPTGWPTRTRGCPRWRSCGSTSCRWPVLARGFGPRGDGAVGGLGGRDRGLAASLVGVGVALLT
ncbi:HAD family hydrolase [Kitasatospora sp. NPDC018058]|uniref:HAD family hydrolase n=1 Tax=Kitasatospora sp. NPDC018058 TaxID=3364025 RepID=UPI0037C0F06E